MKYYGGNLDPSPDYQATDHAGHQRAWRFRDSLREAKVHPPEPELPMPQALVDELTDTPAVVVPDIMELIEQTVDVVFWLRGQMTAQSMRGDEEGKPAGKPGSKPPFRVAFMSAADREVQALAHWAKLLGNIEPVSPAYRNHGRIAGTFSDSFEVVHELAECLGNWVAGMDEVPDEVLHDERLGIWRIRSLHYMLWPDLAKIFVTKAPPMPEREDRVIEPIPERGSEVEPADDESGLF